MAEVSLELKEIKKSFTEGEAVLDNISLEISSPCLYKRKRKNASGKK